MPCNGNPNVDGSGGRHYPGEHCPNYVNDPDNAPYTTYSAQSANECEDIPDYGGDGSGGGTTPNPPGDYDPCDGGPVLVSSTGNSISVIEPTPCDAPDPNEPQPIAPESVEISKDPFEDFDNDVNNNTDGGFDNTPYEDYEQTNPWPVISNVIAKENFIGWGTPGIPVNCMDYAKAQISKNGYQISNFGTQGQTIQVYTESGGANVNSAKNGVGYLIYALKKGIPVIVGIDNHSGTSNPDTDNTTDHFVVIVGTGSDSNGKFFRFYDNASNLRSYGANDNNKLYYDATSGLIKGKSQTTYSRTSGFHDYINNTN